MNKLIANVAMVGKYKLKVINSLIHGSPYVAVHLGKKRVAWLSFKTRDVNFYDGTSKNELDGIQEVQDWFRITENFNLAALKWNDFKNGVYVSLEGE